MPVSFPLCLLQTNLRFLWLSLCIDNLRFVNFYGGRVEQEKRKKFSVLSHPITFEELGREQFTLDYLPSDKLAAPELPGSQAIELSPAPLASSVSALRP